MIKLISNDEALLETLRAMSSRPEGAKLKKVIDVNFEAIKESLVDSMGSNTDKLQGAAQILKDLSVHLDPASYR